MVFIGNDNGYLRVADNLVTDFKYGFKGSGACNFKMLETMFPQVIGHRPLGRIHRIGFRLYAAGHAACMGTPVIHQLGHMHYFFRFIRQAQYHVMVLAAIEFGAEQFVPVQKMPVKNAEMANIIIGPQIVNGIIRFKMHGEHFIYIVIFKGSFIAVNIIRLLLIDHLGILVEHGWMDDVIVVKQAYIFPGGHGQAPVRISGYPFVFFQLLIDNPFFSSGASFILFLIFQTDLPHIIMGIV